MAECSDGRWLGSSLAVIGLMFGVLELSWPFAGLVPFMAAVLAYSGALPKFDERNGRLFGDFMLFAFAAIFGFGLWEHGGMYPHLVGSPGPFLPNAVLWSAAVLGGFFAARLVRRHGPFPNLSRFGAVVLALFAAAFVVWCFWCAQAILLAAREGAGLRMAALVLLPFGFMLLCAFAETLPVMDTSRFQGAAAPGFAFVVLNALAVGGLIGFAIPMAIGESLANHSMVHYAAVMRIDQVLGALTGLYVVIRGFWLVWRLTIFGYLAAGLVMVGEWVFR